MSIQSTARLTVLILAPLFTFTACSSNPSRQDIGLVTGAVVGGVVGSSLTGGSTAGTVGGAAAGGYLGSRIAKDLK